MKLELIYTFLIHFCLRNTSTFCIFYSQSFGILIQTSLLEMDIPFSSSTMEILQNSSFLRALCSNSGPADLLYDNTSELFRISTFAKFPPTVAVTERSLARAGFYYTGVGDRVQCFRCNATAENWQAGECPTERHRQISPTCTFIQSLPSTSSLLSSSHSAFSPLRHLTALQVSASVTTPAATYPGQTEEQVGFLGFPTSPLSSRGLEDASHQRPAACHNAGMCREQERLDSFQNWSYTAVTPADLAKAGFYYMGQADCVACFCCGGQLSNWEPGDRAVLEHQRHYPNCRFVRGERTENVPIAVGGLVNVSNPLMQQCEERLLTFVNWPSRIPVRPDQLAKAGFYYVGRNDDVKCFCCDGGLRCWESGDDPWVEHAKWFPRCEYLLQEKGQEFVHQIQARFPRLFEQLLTNGDSSSREFVDPPVVHLGPGEERSEDAVMMNTPVTVQELVSDLLSAEDEKREEEKERFAEEMASDGFTFLKKHHIALTQRLKSVQSLMDHLLEQSVILQREYDTIASCTSVKQQTSQLIDLVLSKGNAAAEVFRNWIKKNDVYLLRELMAQSNEAASPSQDLSDLPMEEQLRRLQEERTCKVCMDKEVNIVFIPCGHLVVCKECAPSLRKCPICRGLVKGTVRTFLS
uniref:Baculoviral IAP repeat containing 2 n=1 Tax=Paramormyrops kingsleyae TaxID=1676925 RepID=A0A3B3T3Q4_9TELE